MGKAEILKHPDLTMTDKNIPPVQLWALGDMLPLAFDVAGLLEKSGIPAGVVNPRFIKPLDEELLVQHASNSSAIVTIENGITAGGFGTGIEEFLTKKGLDCKILKFGWNDEYVPHGSRQDLMKMFGLTPEAIFKVIRNNT